MQLKIVKSLCGHDRGRHYAVISQNGNFLFLSDGKHRLISAPKKKNVKHVVFLSSEVNLTNYTDKSLRKLINRLNNENVQ